MHILDLTDTLFSNRVQVQESNARKISVCIYDINLFVNRMRNMNAY